MADKLITLQKLSISDKHDADYSYGVNKKKFGTEYTVKANIRIGESMAKIEDVPLPDDIVAKIIALVEVAAVGHINQGFGQAVAAFVNKNNPAIEGDSIKSLEPNDAMNTPVDEPLS
jgi:hypothetical protein